MNLRSDVVQSLFIVFFFSRIVLDSIILYLGTIQHSPTYCWVFWFFHSVTTPNPPEPSFFWRYQSPMNGGSSCIFAGQNLQMVMLRIYYADETLPCDDYCGGSSFFLLSVLFCSIQSSSNSAKSARSLAAPQNNNYFVFIISVKSDKTIHSHFQTKLHLHTNH